MLEFLGKRAEAEQELKARITDKMEELDEVLQNLTDKKSEVQKQEKQLKLIRVQQDVAEFSR